MPNDHLIQDPLFPDDSQGREDQNGALRPVVERDPGAGALGPGREEGSHPERVLVRVVSVRKRLLDEDNLCPKYVIDCCRYAGLIPDDAPEKVRIQVGQRKPEKGEEEHTMIEIYNPEPEGRAGS